MKGHWDPTSPLSSSLPQARPCPSPHGVTTPAVRVTLTALGRLWRAGSSEIWRLEKPEVGRRLLAPWGALEPRSHASHTPASRLRLAPGPQGWGGLYRAAYVLCARRASTYGICAPGTLSGAVLALTTLRRIRKNTDRFEGLYVSDVLWCGPGRSSPAHPREPSELQRALSSGDG